MSQYYIVDTASPMGEPYTPNRPGAKAIQSFWCTVQGVDRPVMIGKQVPNYVKPGDQIYGDLMDATSQRGTPYFKFKGQKPEPGTPRPPSQAAAPAMPDASGTVPGWFVPYGNMIRKLYDQATQQPAIQEREPMPQQVADDAAFGYDRGEQLSAEKKKELEDVFGGGMFDEETTSPDTSE